MNIITSIHDEWFQLIKNGAKTIEVRKTYPTKLVLKLGNGKSVKTISFIYWYNTKTKLIEGRSKFDYISLSKNNDNSHDCVFEHTLITGEEMEKYLGNRKYYYHWYLGNFESIEMKLPQGKRAPQSWCYYDTIFNKE